MRERDALILQQSQRAGSLHRCAVVRVRNQLERVNAVLHKRLAEKFPSQLGVVGGIDFGGDHAAAEDVYDHLAVEEPSRMACVLELRDVPRPDPIGTRGPVARRAFARSSRSHSASPGRDIRLLQQASYR